jgi:chromosome segregation ATPase
MQRAEEKLKADLAARPTVKAVDAERFSMSVKTALDTERIQSEVAEAEARLAAALRRKDMLSAEVKVLEDKKQVGLDDIAATANVDVEEVKELVAKSAQAREELDALEAKHVEVKTALADLEQECCNKRVNIKKVEEELAVANSATATSVADSAAAKTTLQELLLEHSRVAAKVTFLSTKLSKLVVQDNSPKFSVKGGAFADGKLGRVMASPMRAIHDLSSAAARHGIAGHFVQDAPLDVGAAAVGASTQPSALVEAVVSDLKTHLAHAVEARVADKPN